MAPNTAQKAMLECRSPPGRGASQWDRTWYRRSDSRLWIRTSPIITNRGMATSTELLFTFQAICPSMSHSGRSEKSHINAMPMRPRALATCSPARNSTVMSRAAIPRIMGRARLLRLRSSARHSEDPHPARVATAVKAAASARRLKPTPKMP